MNRTFEAVVDIDRILAAVDNVSADLDRERLVRELENVKRDYAIAVFVRATPAERRKKLEALIAAAEEFRERAGEWEGDYWLYQPIREITPPLATLIHRAKKLHKLPKGSKGRPKPIDATVPQLYGVLKNHLGEDAVCIKRGVRGGFISLAMVALEVMGIDNDGDPYARKTIANAMRLRR
jgi:hypothetical protein